MVVLIVLCLGVEFVFCHHLMCVFICYVKFGRLGGHLLGKRLPIRLTICFLSISTCFPPRFLECEFLSDCAIS